MGSGLLTTELHEPTPTAAMLGFAQGRRTASSIAVCVTCVTARVRGRCHPWGMAWRQCVKGIESGTAPCKCDKPRAGRPLPPIACTGHQACHTVFYATGYLRKPTCARSIPRETVKRGQKTNA